MLTQLRFVKDRAYAIRSCTEDPVAFGYFYFADVSQSLWRCFLFDTEGEELEEVGSGFPLTDELQICLPEAAGYHRAARLHREPAKLSILDFAGDRTVDYHAPEPWRVGPAQWIRDAFYWIEWQAASLQSQTVTRLMTAERDFLEPQQISSDFEIGVPPSGDWGDAFVGPDFTTTAAAIFIETVSEQQFWVRVRFDLFSGEGSQGPALDFNLPVTRTSGWPVRPDLSIRLAHDGLVSWDGDTHSLYEPWNPDNLSGDFADMFLAGDRIYVSWGISTPIEPNASPSDGISNTPFHSTLRQPRAFCLA